jgi:hypothetical protein
VQRLGVGLLGLDLFVDVVIYHLAHLLYLQVEERLGRG